MKERLLKSYKNVFGEIADDSVRFFLSPGRVNLIGEHTDYNGGHVFPCALTVGTYAAAAFNDDGVFRLYSENFKEDGIRTFSLDDIKYDEKNGWTNYVLGVIEQFMKAGYPLDRGITIIFDGNIPNGAGLSSSASLELAVSIILNTFFALNIDMMDMVLMSQKAENEFIGVQCGVMDQFAIGMGKRNHAMLLNTNTMAYEYTHLEIDNYMLVIANTNKRRGLADSKYNERRNECGEALKDLQKSLDIASLGDLDEAVFDTYATTIESPTARKRAKHAVYENRRTIKAHDVLKDDQLKAFGKLMNESHISLRDDYEVSCKELDVLVELAWKQEGVLGARMTGAGFGGCTVNLVEISKVDRFIENVGKAYGEMTEYTADFYKASIGDGAREI